METIANLTGAPWLHKFLVQRGVTFLSPALIALLIIGFTFLLVFRLGFSGYSKGSGGYTGKKGNAVLLLGISDSGKTAMFYQLRNGTFPETLTSLKENVDTINFTRDDGTTKSVRVIDFPGHHRFRQSLSQFLAQAEKLVFVINANADDAILRKSAGYLYDVFTNPVVSKNQLPVFIACNKSELVTARPKEYIQKAVEMELNELRRSRTATPGQAEQDGEVYLGIEGEQFKLDHLSFPVTLAEVSAKDGSLEAVKSFIAS